MPDYERTCRPLFLGERKELRREPTRGFTVERNKVH
jgi:hypothetical protein